MSTETRRAGGRGTRRKRSLSDLQSPVWFDFGAWVVGVVLRFWIRRYRAIGAENVPDSGGAFVIANHTSGMDPFLLGYPIRRLRPLGPGKTEIFTNPVFSYVMRKLGIFPLRQGVADANAVRSMVELYRAGRVMMVFPEGGRSRDGALQPFLPDFARLVIKLRARIVPAGMVGARDVVPIGHYLPRRNVSVAVAYGEPFELSEYYDRKLTTEDTQEAALLLQQRVVEMIEVAESNRIGGGL